jgi:hypothetical protein
MKNKNSGMLLVVGFLGGTLVCICFFWFMVLVGSGVETPDVVPNLTQTVSAIRTDYIATVHAERTANAPTVTQIAVVSSTPRPTYTPRPTQTPAYGNFSNPFPLGMNVSLSRTVLFREATFDFQVVNTTRGQAVTDMVYVANMFNLRDLTPEQEFVLIEINVTLKSGVLELSRFGFDVVSNGQIFGAMTSPCCTNEMGYPDFDANLALPGTTYHGWIIRPVFKNDSYPMIVMGLSDTKNPADALVFDLFIR